MDSMFRLWRHQRPRGIALLPVRSRRSVTDLQGLRCRACDADRQPVPAMWHALCKLDRFVSEHRKHEEFERSAPQPRKPGVTGIFLQ